MFLRKTLSKFKRLPRVQTPFGPLKSGMPADVLTPAPVWKTTCLLCLIRSASADTFLSTSWGSESNKRKPLINHLVNLGIQFKSGLTVKRLWKTKFSFVVVG